MRPNVKPEVPFEPLSGSGEAAPSPHDPNQAYQNTDRELWRERPGDYYADSIFVTERGGIGINCGGLVITLPVREWHKLGRVSADAGPPRWSLRAVDCEGDEPCYDGMETDAAGEWVRWDDIQRPGSVSRGVPPADDPRWNNVAWMRETIQLLARGSQGVPEIREAQEAIMFLLKIAPEWKPDGPGGPLKCFSCGGYASSGHKPSCIVDSQFRRARTALGEGRPE